MCRSVYHLTKLAITCMPHFLHVVISYLILQQMDQSLDVDPMLFHERKRRRISSMTAAVANSKPVGLFGGGFVNRIMIT